MDKFDSLRNSIRQILEQEEQLGRMSPEDRKKLVDMLSQQKPKNDSMSQDSAMDDEQVKKISTDTGNTAPIIVDEKVIDDILYRNKYKIGYVEYNGLMHLLCVLKVYGQKNPLNLDVKVFINLVSDYVAGSLKNASSETQDSLNKSSSIEQSQEIEPKLNVASHNISNKNRLVEVADLYSVHNLQSHIQIIIDHIYKDPDSEVVELRSANVKNSIKQANNAISSGLGFFTEILFFTYLTNAAIWKGELEKFKALQTVFNLHLDNLMTVEDTYNASVDFAVMYFLLLDVNDKTRKSLYKKLNDYIFDNQWNHRKQHVDDLASAWSSEFSVTLNHCIEILKKLQEKFSNSRWESGQVESETSSPHPQYDLWLVESKNNGSKDIHAKIDIKSYLPNSLIAPTTTSHDVVGPADFFGFINFERKQRPFTETEISNLKYTIKYLIIKKDEVKNLIKQSIKDEDEGKTYNNIFALGNGDPYHPKEYNAGDLSSQTDPFTLEYYKSNIPYVVRGKKPKKPFVLSDNKAIGDVSLDKDLIAKYFDLELTGKVQAGSGDANTRFKQFRSVLQEKIELKLNSCPEYPIKDIVNPLTPESKIREPFRNYTYILDGEFKTTTVNMSRKFYLDMNTLHGILKESIDETVRDVGRVSLFLYSGKIRCGFFQHVIKTSLLDTLEKNKDKIFGIDAKNVTSKKSVLIKLLTKYFLDKHPDGFYKDLDDHYQALASLYPRKIVESHTCTSSLLRSIVRNILEESDKKSYSGSHPEESYGWSAKEEHFMFDMPGLTTWEKDRQRVKEYLRSMGMLAPKKEKKK